MKLSIKTKFGILLASVNILLTSLFLVSFVGLLYFLVKESYKRELALEAKEILSTYIAVTDERIQYVETAGRGGLQEDAARDEFSVQVYNVQLEKIGSFGLFNGPFDIIATEDKKYTETVNSVLSTSKIEYYTYLNLVQGTSHISIVYPIKKGTTLYGVLVVAKDTHILVEASEFIRTLLLFVLPLYILVNILLAQYLARQAFGPIKLLIQEMKKVSVGNSNKKLTLRTAHADDEIVQLTTTFNEMSERITEGFRKQQEFISNASHELKSPLARVLSDLELLEETEHDAKRRSSIQTARNDIQELATNTDTLLLLAKIDTTSTDIQRISLSSIVSDLLEQYATEISNGEFTIDNTISPKSAITFSEKYLRIMLRNIVDNAVKYTKKGGTIRFSLSEEGTATTLHVENTSAQPTVNTAKISERFYREKRDNRGFGIGLSIVKDICEAYGLIMTAEYHQPIFCISISGFSQSRTS